MLTLKKKFTAFCLAVVWTNSVGAQTPESGPPLSGASEKSVSEAPEQADDPVDPRPEEGTESPTEREGGPDQDGEVVSQPESGAVTATAEAETSNTETSDAAELAPVEEETTERALSLEADQVPQDSESAPTASAPQGPKEVPAPAPKQKLARTDGQEERPIELVAPFARQGEFIALGAHFDIATADDKGRGWRKPSFGPAFNLRLGEAIVDWADIGLEFGLALPGGDEKLTSGRIIAHTRLYPHERLFIHTGFGFGFAGGPDTEDPIFQRGRYGDVYVLGVGTNLYLGDRNRSGGPIFSPVASFELGPDKEFTTAVFWIGGEFSWWAGLPRDKLKLPLDEAYQRGVHRK